MRKDVKSCIVSSPDVKREQSSDGVTVGGK
nr:MAG TPA: hypothetical protein [Caudoviricetes sp.]